MSTKELATYLHVAERTVLKLVQEGTLPGVKVGNQWRFRKAIVDAWLDDQMLGIRPRYVEPTPSAAPSRLLSLANCFDESHIVAELSGKTKSSVIIELAAHAKKLDLIHDDTWFVGALIQRENLMSSAIGNGVAFPHTLRRHPEQMIKPFLVLGRSQEGIDFDSLDGKPAHLFFVLGLKHEELHLPWLAKLVQMLAQADLVSSILEADGPAAIYACLAAAEQKAESARTA